MKIRKCNEYHYKICKHLIHIYTDTLIKFLPRNLKSSFFLCAIANPDTPHPKQILRTRTISAMPTCGSLSLVHASSSSHCVSGSVRNSPGKRRRSSEVKDASGRRPIVLQFIRRMNDFAHMLVCRPNEGSISRDVRRFQFPSRKVHVSCEDQEEQTFIELDEEALLRNAYSLTRV